MTGRTRYRATARLPLALAWGCMLAVSACAHSGAVTPADADSADAAVPGAAALAELVLERFASGSAEAFDNVYPFPRGRGMVAFAAGRNLPRRPGFARVVWSAGAEAVLALSGHIEFGNTGDETVYAQGFSGLYRARMGEGGGWRLVDTVPLDSSASITSHTLHVDVLPGVGLRVTDTLAVVVHDRHGLATLLNHAARLTAVSLGGQPADYAFGGGLLWVRAPAREHGQLVLEYVVDVAQDSTTGPNSGRFERRYGHVRNQYYWHARGGTAARFNLTVQAPAAFHVATDLPQSETVENGIRTVRGRSNAPVPALSLFYDSEWQPEIRRAGNLQLAIFATPDFTPAPDSLAAAFARVHRLLSDRFGEPHGGYTAVVQGRARQGAGWLYLSNSAIVAAAHGGTMIQAQPLPRASFGHEVAHGWTQPTGPASNFLSEGWATFVESLLIAAEFGSHAERAFWEHQRNQYHTGGFEGSRILDDPLNSGISYHKGAWILRMLRDVVGTDAFDRGIRAYVGIAPGEPAGIEQFIAAMSRAAGEDVAALLQPWLEETALPHITARIEGNVLIVAQHGPLFRLPLELELITAGGAVRRTVQLRQRADTLSIGDVAAVRDVLIDPDHRLLLRRLRGQLVRFELRAPDAAEVALVGDFTTRAIPATRTDDVWVVEVPMTAGVYAWSWQAGGRQVDSGHRVVLPERHIEAPYPR